MQSTQVQTCPRCHSPNFTVFPIKVRLLRQPFLQFLSGIPLTLYTVLGASIISLILTGLTLLTFGLVFLAEGLDSVFFSFGSGPLFIDLTYILVLLWDLLFFWLIWPEYFRAPVAHGKQFACMTCNNRWYGWQPQPVQEYAHIKHTKTLYDQSHRIEGVECSNPLCNSRDITSIPYWETLTRSPFYNLARTKYYLYALYGAVAIGTAQLLVPVLNEVLPVNFYLISTLLMIYFVGQFLWFGSRGWRLVGRNFTCNTCKYNWTELDPQPELTEFKISWYEKELAIARKKNNQDYLIGCCLTVSHFAQEYLDQPERATLLAQEALTLAQTFDKKWQLSSCYNSFGYRLIREGHLDESISLFEKALLIAKETKNWDIYSATSHSLGLALVLKGDYTRAVNYFKDTVYFERKREGYQPKTNLYGLDGLAQIALARGYFDQTLRICAFISKTREDLGIVLPKGDQTEFDRLVGQAGSRFDPSAVSHIWQQGAAMSLDDTIRYAWQIV